MFRMIMNAIFRQRKVRAYEVRRMPIGMERRWIALSGAARARLEAERGR